MTYSIATIVKCPGPSKTMSILSSCLWFKNDKDIEDTNFFLYDTLSTFAFGYDETNLLAAVNGNRYARCVFVYLQSERYADQQLGAIIHTFVLIDLQNNRFKTRRIRYR